MAGGTAKIPQCRCGVLDAWIFSEGTDSVALSLILLSTINYCPRSIHTPLVSSDHLAPPYPPPTAAGSTPFMHILPGCFTAANRNRPRLTCRSWLRSWRPRGCRTGAIRSLYVTQFQMGCLLVVHRTTISICISWYFTNT